MLRTKAVAAVVLMPLLLVACDGEQPARGDSAVAEIVDSGYAAKVEVSGAGQVLVAYEDPPEDDEGTYLSAWRLYDESGDRVAEGRGTREEGGSAVPRLWPPPEGFLMRRPHYAKDVERIHPDGVVSPVRFVDRMQPTRAGDVLVSEPSQTRARFYRPSDDAIFRLPALARGLNTVAIDQSGGVWVVLGGDDAVTIYSRDGRPPWRALDYDLPPGSYPAELQISGDAAILPLVDQASRTSEVIGLLAQDVESPGAWNRVELDGVNSRQWIEPEVAVVAPGRLLLGDWGPRWYVGSGGAWTRIALPDAEKREDFFLEAKGGQIYARSTQHSGLRWSDDLGRTWHDFAR